MTGKWTLLCMALGCALTAGAEIVSADVGRDVGDGNVRYATPYDPKSVSEVTFVAPTAAYPYYEIVLPLGDWSEGSGASVQKVLVNGVDSDSFYVFVDGFSHVQSGWITRESSSAPNVVLVTRSLWHDNEAVSVEVHITASGAAQPIVKKFEGKAPAKGGGPKGWRRYQSVVLHEMAGLERKHEPVEFSLTVRAEDCADLERELRLFAVDAATSELKPLPMQTFNPKQFRGRPAGTSNPNYLQHPSKSVEAVFLADVAANASQAYVFVYDNPKADAPKSAETDLKVTGESLGATVENEFFIVDLDDGSGQIASVQIKGRESDPAPLLTNSSSHAAHWNPDSFTDNGKWGHTFAWNPPDEVRVTARGPLMFRITCSGRMPDSTPEVHASVTYSFYAGVPYIKASTVTKVTDPVNVNAIRNGELVLDSHLVTHFVWQEKTGTIKQLGTLHGPNWQDEWGTRVDHDVPWLAMTNEHGNYGIAEIIESSIAFDANRGEAVTHRPAFYLYYHHFWSIPLTYFTRGWVYPFSDYQRGPIIPVEPGSTYVEKMNFYPGFLGEGENRYATWTNAATKTKIPLQQRWGR